MITKQTEKLLIQWAMDHPDVIEMIEYLTHQGMQDWLIYGYFPWDYAKEISLCMKHQKILPAIKQLKG